MKKNSNFDFLKEVDKNLYEIISEAENLYRDQYFEQCMTQTRRFGEHICRNVLGQSRTTEITFDEMLATLKDKSNGFEQEKEFIDDLYFLKKQGNASTHASTVNKNSISALECLKRAFETSISYVKYAKKSDANVLNLEYDINLLVTGKKSKKSLAQKYEQEKTKLNNKTNNKKSIKKNSSKSKKTPQVSSINSVKKQNGLSKFWILVGITSVISCIIAIFTII